MKNQLLNLLVLVTISKSISFAQNNLPNVIPSSPNAVSLGKYGDVPVSLYTGTPQINVPLWEIKEKNATLPISLSYHASGIKVEESASWVGQGWSLLAGGVITRTVRGLPDEQDNGYSGYSKIGEKVERFLNNQMTEDEKLLFQKNVAEGIWDTEPDIFYFNFAGKSGKIIFDKNNEPIVIPNQKLKIEGDPSIGFAIITEDGTSYSFGAIETTQRLDACDLEEPQPFNSSWYLTNITYNGGEQINFNYADGLVYQNILPSETHYNLIMAGHSVCNGIGLQTGCTLLLKTTTKRLQSISTSFTTQINFIAEILRSDLPPPSEDYQLDKIEIRNNGELIKKYELQYEYSGECGDRLILTSIQEVSSDNITISPYEFVYHNAHLLPCKTSKAQDHWGYYNGKPQWTLVPEHFYINQYNQVIYFSGSDRSTDAQFSKIGILTKIKYPTQGTTEFVYEPNNYGYVMHNAEVNEPKLRPEILNVQVVSPESIAIENFQIGTTQYVKVEYAVNISEQGVYPDNGEFIEITNEQNQVIASRSFGSGTFYLRLDPGIYTLKAYSENPETTTFGEIYYKFTEPGVLKNLYCGGVRIKEIIDYDGIHDNKRIKFYDYILESDPDRSSGVLMGTPKYDYYFTKHVVIPVLNTANPDEAPCQYLVRTSITNSLGSTQGGHIGYREVRERDLNNGVSVTKFFSPVEYPDPITFGYPFPIGTSYDYKRGLLKQKTDYLQIDPNNFSTVQKKINTYSVSEFNRKTITGLRIGYIETHEISPWLNTFSVSPYEHVSEWQYQSQSVREDYSASNQDTPLVTSETFEYANPQHMQLTSVVTTASNGEHIEKKMYYPADYETDNSTIQFMKGSKHIHNTPIESIIKTKKQNTWFVIGGEYINFSHFVNSQGVNAIVPSQIKKLELENPINENEFIESANNNAITDNRYTTEKFFTYNPETFNVVEIRNQNNYPTSYLWSYNGLFAIAEFNNLSYAQLQNALAESLIEEEYLHNGFFTDEQIRQFIEVIKGEIPQARVTGYTHSPLRGITSRTDVNNQITFYEYDTFGRLKTIRDNNSNILKKYQYRIKN